jgi:predicted Zn-dependent protease
MESSFRLEAKKVCENNSDLYIDLNYFMQKESRIVVDLENTEISKDNDLGIKIRLWDGEKFLENATTKIDKESINQAAEKLINDYNNSKINILEIKELKYNSENLEKEFKSEINEPFSNLSLEEKTEKLKKLRDDVKKIDKDILNVKVVLVDTYEKHEFVNKHKSLSQEITLGKLIFVAYVKCNDGSNRMAFKSFVDNDLKIFETAYNHFDEFETEVLNMKKAQKLKTF